MFQQESFVRYPTDDEKKVFGAHCRIDPKTNRPIEDGIGAPGHETMEHYEARRNVLEPKIIKNQQLGLGELNEPLRKELIECERNIALFQASKHPSQLANNPSQF